MNKDVLDVRRTYEYLSKSNTHLVQSSDIATVCVCQNLFKLDYPYEAITSDRDYLIANTVHDIMSLCMVGPILENWQTGPNKLENLTRRIISDSKEIVNVIIEDIQEIASKENRIVPPDC